MYVLHLGQRRGAVRSTRWTLGEAKGVIQAARGRVVFWGRDGRVEVVVRMKAGSIRLWWVV